MITLRYDPTKEINNYKKNQNIIYLELTFLRINLNLLLPNKQIKRPYDIKTMGKVVAFEIKKQKTEKGLIILTLHYYYFYI